jgi:hypothetical protein
LAESGNRSIGDTRVFEEGDYFLPRSFVDQFAGEVKSSTASSQASKAEAPHDLVDEAIPPEDEDDHDYLSAHCTRNWKAAASEEKKRMWGAFEETGIFACACRHGLILWIIDMIRSGEL